MNWMTLPGIRSPAARRARPNAAVLLPLPLPVKTSRSPRRRALASRRSARCPSVSDTSGLPVADAGLLECRHLVECPNGSSNDRQREQGSSSLAEAQVEIQDRMQPEPGQSGCVAQLLGAVACDQIV